MTTQHIRKAISSSNRRLRSHPPEGRPVRADYMYTGPWAAEFVDAVQGIGGHITSRDMANYQAIWAEPRAGVTRDTRSTPPGFPAYGGINIIEAMKLIEAADLSDQGKLPAFRGDSLLVTTSPAMTAPEFFSGTQKDVNAYMQKRLTKDHVRHLWEKIKADGGFYESLEHYAPLHSDAVVVIDDKGNMAAMMHSINTITFGETGLIIGGVSVSDAVTNQLDVARATKPGLASPILAHPVVVLNHGQPFGAVPSIGAGLHQRLANTALFSILEFGMTPQQR